MRNEGKKGRIERSNRNCVMGKRRFEMHRQREKNTKATKIKLEMKRKKQEKTVGKGGRWWRKIMSRIRSQMKSN